MIQRRIILTIAIATFSVLMLFGVSSWYGRPGQGFGIYLVKDNRLIIADNDVLSYTWNSHTLKLTEEGARRIRELSVPVVGEPFVLKVNGEELYRGYFWTSISSISCNGIMIDVLRITDNCVSLENGYPSESFFTGADPRDQKEVFEYFQRIGKLVQ